MRISDWIQTCALPISIDFGAERRRVRVVKMRGIQFRGGYHDFIIAKGGLRIFPRLIAAEHHADSKGEFTPSGNSEIDKLLGGGLERGTNALFIGAAGRSEEHTSELQSLMRSTSAVFWL